MELMLIVWLVSTLATIKMFVSEHLFVIVLAFVVLYICSKLNKTYIRAGLSNIELYDGAFTTTKPATFCGREIPKGTQIHLDKYSEYCYVTSDRLGIYRLKVDNNTVRTAFDLTGEDVNALIPVLSDKNYKPMAWVLSLMLTLNILLPSDTTMKYMAGAYLLQTTYESDVVQKGIPLINKAVLNTLESWARDTPDLRILIDSTGTSLTQEGKKDGK